MSDCRRARSDTARTVPSVREDPGVPKPAREVRERLPMANEIGGRGPIDGRVD